VFLKDNLPLEFAVGNVGNALHWWNGLLHPCGSAAELAEFQRAGESKYMAGKWRQFLDFLKSNPRTFVWRSLRRFVYMWTGYWSFQPEYLRGEPFDPANIPFCTACTLLAALGFYKAFQQDPHRVIPYALVLLVFPMVYYVTHSDLAYRNPLDPEIVIFGSYAMLSWRPSKFRSHASLEGPVLEETQVCEISYRSSGRGF
jgi:hypothetical protein